MRCAVRREKTIYATFCVIMCSYTLAGKPALSGVYGPQRRVDLFHEIEGVDHELVSGGDGTAVAGGAESAGTADRAGPRHVAVGFGAGDGFPLHFNSSFLKSRHDTNPSFVCEMKNRARRKPCAVYILVQTIGVTRPAPRGGCLNAGHESVPWNPARTVENQRCRWAEPRPARKTMGRGS